MVPYYHWHFTLDDAADYHARKFPDSLTVLVINDYKRRIRASSLDILAAHTTIGFVVIWNKTRVQINTLVLQSIYYVMQHLNQVIFVFLLTKLTLDFTSLQKNQVQLCPISCSCYYRAYHESLERLLPMVMKHQNANHKQYRITRQDTELCKCHYCSS